MEHQHRIGPGGGEQFLALIERGQPERRGIGYEMAHRMRIEGGDDGRTAFRARPGHRLADHRLMAQVEPVEIAQRDDRAAQVCGNGVAVVEPHTRSSVTKSYGGSPSSGSCAMRSTSRQRAGSKAGIVVSPGIGALISVSSIRDASGSNSA